MINNTTFSLKNEAKNEELITAKYFLKIKLFPLNLL